MSQKIIIKTNKNITKSEQSTIESNNIPLNTLIKQVEAEIRDRKISRGFSNANEFLVDLKK